MEMKIPSLLENRRDCPKFQGVLLALGLALTAEFILGGAHAAKNVMAPVSRIFIVFLSLYVIYRFAYAGLRTFKPKIKDIFVLTLISIASILFIGLGRILSDSFVVYFSSSSIMRDVTATSWEFATPYAAGALLVQAILGLHFGIVFSLSLALIVSVYSPGEVTLSSYVLCSSIVACLSLSKFRSRSAYTKAGLNLMLISFPYVLASLFIENITNPTDILLRFFMAILAGALCSFISAGLTPIFEFLGGYVTDMRLIEMATLDHPLLKELSIQAPGTWNHSMVMGMMVESAANAIGANSVVSRVGAYFHDIGKMKKPLYFVENQIAGENRHDKLSPSMSALIIRSHVKDGIELAKKHNLPQVIEDMIPEHHGTSLIEYFYDKASKEAKEASEDAPEVDASLYTYPGPRPQTKEAGILMLADGVEAAARTISDPTPDRIQGLVQKMINKVFASGELDECELTLKDLHAIAKCFTRVLAGIYHQRIAYAEPAEKTGAKNNEEDTSENEEADLGNTGSAKKQKVQSEEKSDKEEGKEDLKRLGI